MKRPTTLWPPARSIGTQVLLWVNVAWVLLAAVFVAYDYRRDLQERLRELQHDDVTMLLIELHGQGPEE